MLVKLIPEQVSDNWDILAPYFADSLPPIVKYTREGMANILRAVLFEDLHVFIYYNEDDEAQYIVSACIQSDVVVLQRRLVVYTVSAVRDMNAKLWEDGLDSLKKFARSENCHSIVAYSANEQITKFLGSRGANTKYTLIDIEV